MINEIVLDVTAIEAFARADSRALLTVDDCDLSAKAVLLPVTAYTTARHRFASDTAATELLDTLLDIGTVICATLDSTSAPPLADIWTNTGSVQIHDAETAYHAHTRGWPVATDMPAEFKRAFPSVTVTAL